MNNSKFKTQWNWGAFFIPLWFAFANRSYLNLLVLVPVVNIFWIFYGAAKGEEWALQNNANNYESEHEFRQVMDSWNRAGIAGLIFTVVMVLIYFLVVVFAVGVMSPGPVITN